MLTFKAQFPVDAARTGTDLLECVRVWLAGSPHSQMRNKLAGLSLSDGEAVSLDNESLRVSVYRDEGQEIAGARYEKREDDRVTWVTEIVGAKTVDAFDVCVQVSVDSDLPVERLDSGRRPYVLKRIMERMSGGRDGALVVSDRPTYLDESGRDLAARLITADAGVTLPVVYVSATASNLPFIDPVELAKWIAGMAHVVVEPSRAFSFSLMQDVAGENVYGGAVGIYWPDGIGKWVFLPTKDLADPKDLQLAVSRKVRSSLLFQRAKPSCSWLNLQEKIARKRIKELREAGSNDVEAYVRHFDAELKAKEEAIERLEAELLRRKYAEGGARTLEREGRVIQLELAEPDLFQGECIGIVLDVLAGAAESAGEHTRRGDVLRDIVARNASAGERESILEKLNDVLRQYKSMSAGARAVLEEVGFEIQDEGKHYKLVFRGDSRYPFILAKTSSDWRSGMNAFSKLRRHIF